MGSIVERFLLQETAVEVDRALTRLERLFADDMRLTLVVRHVGGNTEREIVYTRDDLAEVEATIRRRRMTGSMEPSDPPRR